MSWSAGSGRRWSLPTPPLDRRLAAEAILSDELDALRFRIAELEEQRDLAAGYRDKYLDERDRYKKALREIADWPPDGTLEFAAEFAREALKEEKP